MFPPRGTARRSWPGAWLGICATVLAFTWAAPQAGSAATAGAVAARADAAAMRAAVSLPSDGTGTMMVSPASVSASQTTTLTFTYTAARLMEQGSIKLVVPPGWTPPSQTPGPGYTTASCPAAIPLAPPCDLAVSPAAMTITITNVTRDVDYGLTVVITYQGQAPSTGRTSTFTTSEQSYSHGTLTQLTESPTVAVTCPDGAGTMTVSPSAMTASSTGTLTFTYVAGGCGVETGGVIALTVPYGWTRPTTTSGQDGFITSSGGGPPTVSSPRTVSSPITITVPVGILGPDATVSIDYDMARVPASPGDYVFDAAEQSGAGGNLTALAASPAVMVNVPPPPRQGGGGQGTVTPSPPVHPGGAGQMTVEPARVAASGSSTLTFSYTAPEAGLSPSGEVTVQVPAGWTAPSDSPGQAGYASSSRGRLSVSGRLIIVSGAALGGGQKLTIVYAHGTAPSSAGVSTFVTSERPDGTAGLAALAVSPAVTVALADEVVPAASWPTVPVLVVGLVLVACAASGLAIRRLRRGAHAAAGSSVRAVPHTGPPATLAVRDTGTRPTLIVRVEPHPGDPVTTIEEARP